MADPVIVWETLADDENTHVGRVGGIQYFRIYPRYGWTNWSLLSMFPLEITTEPSGEVEELKTLATEHFGNYLTTLHAQMVVMGLLTE